MFSWKHNLRLVSSDTNHAFISELSFMKYIMAEISRGKLMELEEDKYTEKREKVYTFMKIPREFEKVIV